MLAETFRVRLQPSSPARERVPRESAEVMPKGRPTAPRRPALRILHLGLLRCVSHLLRLRTYFAWVKAWSSDSSMSKFACTC